MNYYVVTILVNGTPIADVVISTASAFSCAEEAYQAVIQKASETVTFSVSSVPKTIQNFAEKIAGKPSAVN